MAAVAAAVVETAPEAVFREMADSAVTAALDVPSSTGSSVTQDLKVRRDKRVQPAVHRDRPDSKDRPDQLEPDLLDLCSNRKRLRPMERLSFRLALRPYSSRVTAVAAAEGAVSRAMVAAIALQLVAVEVAASSELPSLSSLRGNRFQSILVREEPEERAAAHQAAALPEAMVLRGSRPRSGPFQAFRLRRALLRHSQEGAAARVA